MTNQFLQRGRRPLWNSLVRKLKKRKETDNKAKENFAVHSNPSACSKPRSFTSQVATCIKKSTGIYRPQEDEIRRHRTLVTVIDFATIPLDLLTAFEREPWTPQSQCEQCPQDHKLGYCRTGRTTIPHRVKLEQPLTFWRNLSSSPSRRLLSIHRLDTLSTLTGEYQLDMWPTAIASVCLSPGHSVTFSIVCRILRTTTPAPLAQSWFSSFLDSK